MLIIFDLTLPNINSINIQFFENRSEPKTDDDAEDSEKEQHYA